MKIGLLPLYLELYDETMPEVRDSFDEFLEDICESYTRKKVEVVLSDISRNSREFAQAVSLFEQANVDSIVTLHLAYSPSLECVDALSKTNLPIIVLDTTRDKKFDSLALLMYNHGIHGVQDMCNLLIRNGKDFFIEAGHIELSDVIDRTISHIKGARMAKRFKGSRIGKIGEAFEGMGDFVVSQAVMESKFGIKVLKTAPSQIAKYLPSENDPEILKEMNEDTVNYDLSLIKEDSHKLSVQTGLALKRWFKKEDISAFTINFKAITKDSGLLTMPFFEICKIMKNHKIGYAGEGDILTAALTGALTPVLGECSFAEMFCPDWEENIIFLSHMGEINFDVVEGKVTLSEKEWPYTDAEPPVTPSACFKSGEAVLVNLAPKSDDTFTLILSSVLMMQESYKETFKDGVRGWMKPSMPIARFLEKYSEIGGTHHIAIVYGNELTSLKSFGRIMEWETIEIK